jgi:LuxR family maltose regulon positive regulatory protein
MGDAGAALLATKLHVPRQRPGTVERPRLRDRVQGGDLPPLTVVSAPAGFGKTTAATDWFGSSARAAWVSLDQRDGDPTLFWRYVAAAIDRVEPGAGAGAIALLEASVGSIDSAVAMLINDVDAISEQIVVVLDDYHLIESIEVHESVAFLLDHLPPSLRLVLLTRADPPLPLAALRAKGDLREVRAGDLRFTDEEAGAYLRGAMDLDLAPEDIARLGERTEGWIAALQLAALSLQGRSDAEGFVAAFSGDDRFVVDYLATEVLHRQPDDLRAFLLETSVLDQLSGDLCDAVTGRTDSRAVLEHLERSNLFLVPLDDQRRWYRYHHLFADVLRAHLAQERPEDTDELHRRASDWLADDDQPLEAIAHAMAGGDPERAARVIELAARAMGQRRQDGARRAALEALPPELLADRPVLATLLAGSRMQTADATGVAELLDLAEASVHRTDPPPIVVDHEEHARLPAQIAIYRAALALLSGDVDSTTAHATRALGLLAADDHFGRGAATALVGLAAWRTGDLATAERRYLEAVDALGAAAFTSDVLGCLVTVGDLQIAQGRLDDAAASYQRGLDVVAAHPGIRGAVDMHVGAAEILLERGRFDEATAALERARDLGPDAGLPQSRYRWLLTAARLQHAQGDLEGCLELLAQAAPVYDTDFSPAARPIVAWQARVHAAQGDLRAARRWADERGLSPTDPVGYLTEFEHLTLAHVLLAEGSADAAVELLQRVADDADAGGRAASAIEALALLARAHEQRGDRAAAAAALDGARSRAEHAGFALPVHGAADRARAATGASTARPRLIDELSDREREVLHALKGDLSGPDIARSLHVSLNTFRTHTKHIFTKLAVNNRREAVRRAAELGL